MAKAKHTVPTKAQAEVQRTQGWLADNKSVYALGGQVVQAMSPKLKVNTSKLPESKNIEKAAPYRGEPDPRDSFKATLKRGLDDTVYDTVEGTRRLLGYKESPEEVASKLLPSVKLTPKKR